MQGGDPGLTLARKCATSPKMKQLPALHLPSATLFSMRKHAGGLRMPPGPADTPLPAGGDALWPRVWAG